MRRRQDGTDSATLGGAALLGATAVALVWANSPWSASYPSHVGWVNDGLMVLFFYVVGLEIKQELSIGQLSSPRRAALPVVAALGGMVAPALLFVAINLGTPGTRGWGIPMATDIAFAVSVVALAGNRVPASLKLTLLALAVVDDIGAILVIAVFYSEQIKLAWLLLAIVGLGAVLVVSKLGRWNLYLFVPLGVAVWFATLQSGVHATIAGVALGLATPAISSGGGLREAPARRLQNVLTPWTTFAVIPLFALVNAGVSVEGHTLANAASSRITIGTIVGLVVGKPLGITAAAALGVKFRLAQLPDGVTIARIAAMGMVAGVGFTVSIFISGLAFDRPELLADAKIGILVGSLLSAALGSAALRLLHR